MKQYLIRTYDTYFNTVRKTHFAEYIDDEAAITAARAYLHLTIHPMDTCELQVCSRYMPTLDWCIFATVYYCDDDIVVDNYFG